MGVERRDGQEGGWELAKSKEVQPASVFEETMQVGSVRGRWPFAEPAIWTDPMLTTLERGVKGGKWYSLGDKAFSLRSLRAAFAKVKANGGAKGVDGVTIKRFENDLEGNLERLHRELMGGTYRPKPVRRVWIPKPGSNEKRPLGIPTVRDRVAQTSVKAALEPIFEKEFLDESFGFRPGRSCHKALSRVWRFLRDGKVFVVEADFRKFFDTIPHQVILDGLKKKVSDGRLLGLINLYLEAGVMDGWTWEPVNEGTPQGSVVSPLLANIALHGLDQIAKEQGYDIVRYADDFVILCQMGEESQGAMETVREWTASVGLTLHPDKTRVVDYGNGESFDFLGFTFCGGKYFPRSKSLMNLRGKIRELTPRKSGRSMKEVIRKLNPVLRGWFNHFKPCSEGRFKGIDYYVSRRLRSLIYVQHHLKPPANGNYRGRWPMKFFHDAGLYSMVQAKRKTSILSEANH
jgi:RNA-directed DNA polymerase